MVLIIRRWDAMERTQIIDCNIAKEAHRMRLHQLYPTYHEKVLNITTSGARCIRRDGNLLITFCAMHPSQ
jgi:hypothetical protein